MKHGANIYKYASEIGCKSSEIIDFSSNINSYHPNIDITLTNDMLVKYPNTNYSALKKTISKKYEIKKSQVALFNGATSAIFELFKTFKDSKVYLYAPLYGEYEKAVQDKSKIVKINRFKNIYIKPEKGSVVVFVNPSTPDASHYNLDKLFSIWREQKCTVVLDESFLEFQKLKSLRNQINYYKKLYIIQSFTKFYACGGVRIGAIFSNKSNIQKLKTPMWNLSSFDAKFLEQRLQDAKFDKQSTKLHKQHKEELLSALKESKLFSKIYNSDSNFVMVKSEKSKEIFEHLLTHKILVRTCGSFDFLTNEYLRFAVKDSKAHNKLTEALKSFS
ncbi:aminotransferase class I/II-fold pyridoxal phosphate-dependent enzyme [Sulfurimonas sp.]|uniref:aminotransferase class I/II-fold pyridoxal phosphate-dependent enzyme n=1 Tax=Sulfurimonas sp. TaxID=2022749 RepID=UPI0025FA88BE|nr:aminotransferase class I/II-fold pyridoxal phosphate-dependent enzyme [Sulfurimonas sp.]